MKRALITGITGQDGSYLTELLLAKGYEVHGLMRRASSFNTGRIEHLFPEYKERRLFTHYGDLADASNLSRIIEKIHPDEVYNLGAQSHVHVSFEIPEYTAEVGGLGTLRLLDAIRGVKPDTRFYQASSSELYGKVAETPQNERTPFHPRSPYAVAKLYAYWITVNYREAFGLFACNGILFNHESPRRGENFVTRKITKAVAEIHHGRRQKVSLGNLNAQRDWGFAGDYVKGMWLMLQRQSPEDYVLATGRCASVRAFVEQAFRVIGMEIHWQGSGMEEKGLSADGVVRVEVSKDYFRPAEVDLLQGDAGKARRELGWTPEVGIEALADMMVRADIASFS